MNSCLSFDMTYLHNTGARLTAREIAQQPLLWHQTYARVEQYREELDRFLGPILDRQNLRIILTGAGTSSYIGEILAPALCRKTSRVYEAVSTTDIVSSPSSYFVRHQPTLLVSFARSGNSPESIAAINLADQLVNECYHLIITCNQDGQLARREKTSHSRMVQIMPENTNDKGFAMTSSFTTMMLFALCTFSGNGLTRERVRQICTSTQNMMSRDQAVFENLAARDFKRAVFLGSGCLQGLARESALKMLELCDGRVVALHDSPMGFRHGPKSVVDRDTLVVLFMSNDPYTRAYDIDLLKELQDDLQAGSIFAVTSQNNIGLQNGDYYSFDIYKGQDDIWLTFPFVVLAQLLACFKSLHSGINPDIPCPTGEVNRIVQGVTIHAFTGA